MKTDRWEFSKNYGDQLDYILSGMAFNSPEERTRTRRDLIEYILNSLVRRGAWKRCKDDHVALAREIAALPVVKMADIIPGSATREEFMDKIARAFSGEKGYLRQYAAAVTAAGPFPWAWKFDTGYPVAKATGCDRGPEEAGPDGEGKTLDGFMTRLRGDSQLLYYLLKHASQLVFDGNKLVVTAGKETINGVWNLMGQMKKSLESYFNKPFEVVLALADGGPSPAPVVPVETKHPVRSGDADVTEEDMNHIELIMSAMAFMDASHRETVRADLIEYLKEVSIPLNRRRSEKGEGPILNIRKSRIFRFALIVKRAKDKNDYRIRAVKAFKDDQYMHTPGRAVDRVNRGWDFPWAFRFKRRVVTVGRKPVEEAVQTVEAAPSQGVEQDKTNVIHFAGPVPPEPPPVQEQCAAGCGGCERLAAAVAVVEAMGKKMRIFETYLLRHVHQAGVDGTSAGFVPDDTVTKELIKEAANAGR